MLQPYRRNSFSNLCDEVFEDFLTLPNVKFDILKTFKADIKETELLYIVEAELAGINKENINVELKDNILTISVNRKESKDEEKDNYIRRERYSGSMSRSFYVENCDNENVSAKYENGILTVEIPKVKPKENKFRIDIQ